MKKKYLDTVEHLVQMWEETTDGVVVGLRYDHKKNLFWAKTWYQRGHGQHRVSVETFQCQMTGFLTCTAMKLQPNSLIENK